MINQHYTYLALDLASVLFPLLLSFDKKVAFYKLWKFLFPSILISGVFFIAWDVLFTAKGVWGFNPAYITGFYIFNLPIEEILFFVCVPYSCVFIYEVCNAYFKRDWIGCVKGTDVTICIISLIICIVFYNKTYTVVNASICLLLVAFTSFILKFENMPRFYLAYVISLVPFFLCNGILTALPIVTYNDNENMAIRIFTIPVEDAFYCLSLLLSNVLLMNYFKTKTIKN